MQVYQKVLDTVTIPLYIGTERRKCSSSCILEALCADFRYHKLKFLTEEEAFARLTSSKNVNRVFYADRSLKTNSGNFHQGGEIPIDLKLLASAHVMAGMKIKDVGELFGLSDRAVSAAAKGCSQAYDHHSIADPRLQKAQKEVSERVTDKAVDLVMEALNLVAPKLDDKGNKLRDITGAAKDLASIVDKIQPKTAQGNTAAVIVVGTLPYEESRYKTIDVEAKVG